MTSGQAPMAPRSTAVTVDGLASDARQALAAAQDELERSAAAELASATAVAQALAAAPATPATQAAHDAAKQRQEAALALQKLIGPLFTQAEAALTTLAGTVLDAAGQVVRDAGGG